MSQLAAIVFTSSNSGGKIVFSNCQHYQAAILNRGGLYMHHELVRRNRGELDFCFLWKTGCFSNGSMSAFTVAADEFCFAVNYHLRRIRPISAQGLGILLLAAAEFSRGEPVLPAERVPVVHVKAERDHLEP